MVKGLSEEERRADARIGTTTGSAARWLVDFVNLDLETLSEGDWLNLRWEYIRFGRLGIPVQLAPRTMVQKDQAWAKEGIRRLADGQEWSFDFQMTARLKMVDGSLQEEPVGARGAPFAMMVWQALRHTAKHFRLCKECRRPLIAQKRQVYCSVRCSQAVRTRTWRAKHRERLNRQRRAAYRREVLG